MIDIKFLRENPEAVKQNIKNKFQDAKLPLVDEVIELDKEHRAAITEADGLRADRNRLSKEIGALMAKGDREKAEETKKKVTESAKRLEELEKREAELEEKIKSIMMVIPNTDQQYRSIVQQIGREENIFFLYFCVRAAKSAIY